jgi:Zn-dependent protease with chaperone function
MMPFGFLARGIVQVLAAHAIVTTIVALGVLLMERRVMARQPSLASAHAGRLCFLRLAPSLAALLVAWLGVSLSFALWEPRVETEAVGPVALFAAGLGAVLLASGAWRTGAALWQTRRIHRDLRSATRASLPAGPLSAFVVETAFPVVAQVGLVAARLFVARSVVKACTADELKTVIAHELAHASARDNLRRIAMVWAPDVLAWLPAGARLAQAWALAAELAADETAARGPADRLHLASALVKVARLASLPAGPLPASALYGGGPIAERVRRLLHTQAQVAPSSSWSWPSRVALAALVAAAPVWMPLVSAAVEALLKLGAVSPTP